MHGSAGGAHVTVRDLAIMGGFLAIAAVVYAVGAWIRWHRHRRAPTAPAPFNTADGHLSVPPASRTRAVLMRGESAIRQLDVSVSVPAGVRRAELVAFGQLSPSERAARRERTQRAHSATGVRPDRGQRRDRRGSLES